MKFDKLLNQIEIALSFRAHMIFVYSYTHYFKQTDEINVQP